MQLPRVFRGRGAVNGEALVVGIEYDLNRRRGRLIDEERSIDLQVLDAVWLVREEQAPPSQAHLGVTRGREDEAGPDAMVGQVGQPPGGQRSLAFGRRGG